ncbi:MAG: RNA 3'-terminal phosphate cyclase, partial [ANME-2 cluster archaeon]|nr:RNA 3'-terminal phosphate cyclase [ANME-2 cluster archaeon]
MINIDGSYGEGGGQIIRTAVALSAVTGTDVTISNIRSNRPKSGLKAQHMSAIRTAADMTGARISGLKSGSTELTFSPGVSTSGGIPGGYYKIDIGTAGSITLLLQCLMPIALAAQEPVSLDITGGTDVAWSPPIDYMAHVLLPVLETMGLKCNIKLQRRGYYPRGGGRVAAII